MEKKAVIEVQFNWVFILIVGAIILLFFMSVFNWYRSTKNIEIANTALEYIKSTIVGAQASTDTASVVEIPDAPLEFRCDPNTCGKFGCASNFEFMDTGVTQPTEIDIIFAPDKIESDILLTWSLPWEMPYKVTNFLFLSNPKVRYVFVYNDAGSLERAQEVYNLIPQKIQVSSELSYDFKKEIVNASNVKSIKDQNDYLVKFVFFFEPGQGTIIQVHDSLKQKKNWDVLFVYGDEVKGKVKFSKTELNQKKPDDREYSYLGTPTLMGAIFSESAGFYECNMKKAYMRLSMVNLLYWKRAELLKDHYAGDNFCEFFYDLSLLDNFDEINTSVNMAVPNLQNIAENAQEIARTQDIMYSQADCPGIY